MAIWTFPSRCMQCLILFIKNIGCESLQIYLFFRLIFRWLPILPERSDVKFFGSWLREGSLDDLKRSSIPDSIHYKLWSIFFQLEFNPITWYQYDTLPLIHPSSGLNGKGSELSEFADDFDAWLLSIHLAS